VGKRVKFYLLWSRNTATILTKLGMVDYIRDPIAHKNILGGYCYMDGLHTYMSFTGSDRKSIV